MFLLPCELNKFLLPRKYNFFNEDEYFRSFSDFMKCDILFLIMHKISDPGENIINISNLAFLLLRSQYDLKFPPFSARNFHNSFFGILMKKLGLKLF